MLNFLFITSILLSLSYQQSSLTKAKDFKNTNGVQLYIVENSNYFSYMSIDNDTSKLNATLYLYLKDDLSEFNEGIYISIGFGTVSIVDSDIILCAALTNKTGWCRDYIGLHDNISEKPTVTSNVLFKWEKVSELFLSYNYLATWTFTRPMNSSDIVTGKSPALWAYGSILGGEPIKHSRKNYGSIEVGEIYIINKERLIMIEMSTLFIILIMIWI